MRITVIVSTEVLSPENRFSRKLQRYKATMPHCVDIRHLCFWQLALTMTISDRIMMISMM